MASTQKITSPKHVAVHQFIKLTKYALSAVRKSPTSTTFDVSSAYSVIIPAKGTLFIKTDIQIQIPEGFYCQLATCSRLALHQYIDVIDENYNGNIGVILFNHSENPLFFGGVIVLQKLLVINFIIQNTLKLS
jgi:dUTP pyrophosphatase